MSEAYGYATRRKFLTAKEKQDRLNILEQDIQNENVDAEIVPFLEEINAIDGICTKFSCIGHITTVDEGIIEGEGYLSLRMTKPVYEDFIQYKIALVYQQMRENGLSQIETRIYKNNFEITIRFATGTYKSVMRSFIKILTGEVK
jgi:tRNA(Phe) wybutosine-synthesizing methylase Tyw3